MEVKQHTTGAGYVVNQKWFQHSTKVKMKDLSFGRFEGTERGGLAL